MKIVAIIQARMGSSRLPGKSTALIRGKPLLHHVIERTAHSQKIDQVMVATTVNNSDNVIATLCGSLGIAVYRGDENDVLDRFMGAADQEGAQVVVRVTADDPFKDPEVIDKAVGIFLKDGKVDYVSNTIRPTYPLGLDIEVFSKEALRRAWVEATEPFDREHVTPYIWSRADRFATIGFEYERDLSRLRWTVDTPEDLIFAREVYDRVYHPDRIFHMTDILDLLQIEPSLMTINAGIERKDLPTRNLDTTRAV